MKRGWCSFYSSISLCTYHWIGFAKILGDYEEDFFSYQLNLYLLHLNTATYFFHKTLHTIFHSFSVGIRIPGESLVKRILISVNIKHEVRLEQPHPIHLSIDTFFLLHCFCKIIGRNKERSADAIKSYTRLSLLINISRILLRWHKKMGPSKGQTSITSIIIALHVS